MKKRLMMILVMGMLSLHAETTRMTSIPAAQGLVTKETTALSFSSLEMLRETVALSDPIVVEKVVTKLAPFVNTPLFPSELARLMFELAFLDAEPMRLTSQQRTDNMGYILSCLGRGNTEAVLQLYAFYYGYSFEHFAARKK